MIEEEYVKISKKQLNYLIRKEEKLAALENLGVDNWDGYGMQWDEEEIGFHRMSIDEVDHYIDENYERA